MFNNKKNLGRILELAPKRDILFLFNSGACKSLQGESNQDLAVKQAKYIFKKLNATLESSDVLMCLNTDEKSLAQNPLALKAIKQIALRSIKNDEFVK